MRQTNVSWVVLGFVMIFADEAWAKAALDAPAMLSLPNITAAGQRINTNYRATADKAVGNVAFMLDPLRLGEVLEAYLSGTPLAPRPFMTEIQRQRFGGILDDFRDRTGLDFDGHDTIRNYMVTPDYMEALWANQHRANLEHPDLGIAIIMALSCSYAVANHMANFGYRQILSDAIRAQMTVGYTVFYSGTFVIVVTNNFYDDMRYVLNANPPA